MNPRSHKRSVLRLESLQQRELMAVDLSILSSEPVTAEPAAEIATQDAFSTTLVASSATRGGGSVSTTANDAGSTRATAADLGFVDGSRSITGGLSFRDTLDVFRFEIATPSEVDLSLSGLRRNADLFLADADGVLVARNSVSGTGDEQISETLDAGVYFAAVQSRAFWGTGYSLQIDADLIEPIDPSQPLADVDYFGGSREWNLNAVGAPEAWAAGYTGEGILVAVVDTGVDLDHPDLVGNLFVNPGEIAGDGIDNDGNGYIDDVNGYDFAGRDADPDDVNGHGTHVAGSIAAASNGFGATGVAPDATILPVRVLGDNGSGSSNAVAAGIRYAADLGADIINLSLGGGYSRAIDVAIDYAQSLGSLIIAAAGNESASVPGYPAAFSAINENVLSVGAHDSRSRIAGFSNDVGRSGAVQIDAPGVGVFSTYAGGRYGNLSGTSMAAPQVAGVAALALSASPNLTAEQLRDLLVGGVTNTAIGSDAIGVVNAATTVAYAAAGLTAPPVLGSATLAAGGPNSGVTFRTTSLGGVATAVPNVTTTASTDEDETFAVSPNEVVSPNEPEVILSTNKIVSIGEPDLPEVLIVAQQDEAPRDEAFADSSDWTKIELLS